MTERFNDMSVTALAFTVDVKKRGPQGRNVPLFRSFRVSLGIRPQQMGIVKSREQQPQLPPWAARLCKLYESTDLDSTTIRDHVAAVHELLADQETIKEIPGPYTLFILNASLVLKRAQHAVANKGEALRLANRVARISLALIETMSVKELKGSNEAEQVRKCSAELENVFLEAAELLLAFQAGGKDLGSLSVIERFKATHKMYFPDRVGAFVDVHKKLTGIVKEAEQNFSLQNLERCATPSTDDIRNSIYVEVCSVVREVEYLRPELDADTGTSLNQLTTFINRCITAKEMPSARQISQLFEPLKKINETGSRTASLAVVKVALQKVKAVVGLHPFDDLVTAALMVAEMAENAAAHKHLCFLLAERTARINCIVLELASKDREAARTCTTELTAVIGSAVTLLEGFQSGNDLSWTERVKAVYRTYSAETVEKMAAIDESLAFHVRGTVSLLNLDCALSLKEIREAMRDEILPIIEVIQWLEDEKKDDSMSAVLQHLQAILDTPAFKDLPPRQVVFEQCDVVVDTSTTLGSGAFAKVYAGTLYGLVEVAIKKVFEFDGEESKIEAEVRRTMLARHRNVVRVFGCVALESAEKVGVVMERLGVSLAEANVKDPSKRMQYTHDIIAGVEHMHGRGRDVVHFDLKPANILLTQDKRHVKIIDFGVAQTRATLSVKDVVSARGTVRFMAPELFSDDLRPSSACDVYSFAVVLAELWTGALVWAGTPNHLIPGRVASGGRPFSPDDMKAMGAQDPIIALINVCWKQDPHDRPTFEQLGELRNIPNFHLAPREVWPLFLQQHDARGATLNCEPKLAK
jgi:tRNA A-37 threonylcarbamoyl transferase component Bud32